MKAAAATDPRTRGQNRHIEDIAFLLSTVRDPRLLRRELADDDLALLRELVPQLEANGSAAWEHLETRARPAAQATLGFL